MDIFELMKSFEFRKQQTKDLEDFDQPESKDQIPVVVLALVSKKKANPTMPLE